MSARIAGLVLAGLLAGAACSKRAVKTDAAAGAGAGGRAEAGSGGGADAGAGGGEAGGGGGVSGSGGGGASGAGGAPITSCPAEIPTPQIACAGTFSCMIRAMCTCRGCCYGYYRCSDGILMQTTFDDSCIQGPPCPDGGAGTSGGTAGTGGGVPITSCPAARPTIGTACTGTFTCNYNDTCLCNVCCFSSYGCTNGSVTFLDSNRACMQVLCPLDAATDTPPGVVCYPGLNGTCNDDPRLAGIYGSCTDAGTCACSDAGTNPDSGRCLAPFAMP